MRGRWQWKRRKKLRWRHSTVTLAERLLVAVAMITTFPAVPGAVYVVLAPLAVCAGLNEPQAPDGVQLQSTPALELSFATVAPTDAVAPRFNVEGGAVVRAMEVVPVLLLAGIPEVGNAASQKG